MLTRRTVIRGTAVVGATATTVAAPVLDRIRAAARPAARGAGLDWPSIGQETRPWTRWWWLGSAVTGHGLTSALLQMRQAGFGGVEVQPIYEAQGYEDRVLEYLSRDWLAALDTTVRRANRFDLGVDLTSGSGWTMGGPWISPELSAGRVLVERWTLAGGERLAAAVRTVQPGHPGLVDEERLSRPDLRPPMAPLPEPPLDALVAREASTGETVVLTDRVDQDGRLDWTAPPGQWELTGVFAGLVLKRVERAGPGGKGLHADYFGGKGIAAHLDRLHRALGPGSRGLRASFHDSFELEPTDWSRSFLTDFSRRRGYDLVPYLPDLLTEGEPDETALRVTADVRQTLSELFVDNFCTPWDRWSRQHGWSTRNQAHGSPANLLDVYAAADIPETEYTGAEIVPIPGVRQGLGAAMPPVPMIWRLASSAAHLTGGTLVSSETATWRDEHHHVALSQIKPSVDLLFSAGVNHVFYHGSTYTPEDVTWPGFTFYASTDVNPFDNLWRDLPELNAYITRCQSVLQSGEHGNDVLVYWPQPDLWSRADGGLGTEDRELSPDYKWQGRSWMYGEDHSPGEVVGRIEAAGWQLDWVSDTLLDGFRSRRGRIANDHASYAVVVVPPVRFMPVDTLERLVRLAEDGGRVVFIGALPEDVPGFGDLEKRRRSFRGLLTRLERNPRATVVDEGGALDEALAASGAAREPIADSGARVLRRRHRTGWNYFVTNCTAAAVSGWFRLGVPAAGVGVLDPLWDRSGPAATRRAGDRLEVRLHLEPGQSLLLRTFDGRPVRGTPLSLVEPGETALPVDGPWQLTFTEGGPTLPPTRELATLASWTDLGEEATAFSGTARYRTTFDMQDAAAARDWLLDLGDVRESARVWLNGSRVGTAWSVPFLVPLGGLLRAGRNVLEIEVTNLTANRFRAAARSGELDIPHYINWRSRIEPQDWTPMPSGLLGPVRLVEQAG